MCEIIGRKKEIDILKRCFKSEQPEFVALYGRRRIGKTFLVTRAFNEDIIFSHTGLAPVKGKKNSLKNQLQNFYYSLLKAGAKIEREPKSWLEAFYFLQNFLEQNDNGTKQVVFIDEVSWMDSPNSNFTSALESFWNGWGNRRNNLLLIICSSATSWMLENVINDNNGFYRRLTETIHLTPFNLAECYKFFKSRGIKMTYDDVLQSYMILGGIPYYLNLFKPDLSLAQNIDALFYGKNPKLENEFEYLFSAVFKNSETHKKIVEFLATRRHGYTKKEITENLKLTDNGEFYKVLKALEKSDFIREDKSLLDNNTYLRLCDNFCLFWLHFYTKHQSDNPQYWSLHNNSPEIKIWEGYAFEDVCFNHIQQIKTALGISGIDTTVSSIDLKGNEENRGIQIDMIIARADNVINLCEMKYTKTYYCITKDYYKILQQRIDTISSLFPKRNIHLTFIAPYGLTNNVYAMNTQSIIDIYSLFEN